ncbi:hypothetical protein M3F62_010440 [Micrococcus luteus]|nr:hypothetical protein [Micrococcus luteus]
MRAAVSTPAASGCSPKPTPQVINRLTFTVKELETYLRRELGLSRRGADLIARHVETFEPLARDVLPERWADDLHPHPARHLRSVDRLTEAGNVGPDRTPTMGEDEHAAYQTLTRGRRRDAALAYIDAHNNRRSGAVA